MRTQFLWAAALVSLVAFAGHVFVGGPRVAGPILRSGDLPDQAKWLGYFCWHVTSLVVLAMSVGFAVVARHPDRPELAVFLTVLSGLIWVLSIGITVFGAVAARRNPGIWLFGLITLLGAAGLAF